MGSNRPGNIQQYSGREIQGQQYTRNIDTRVPEANIGQGLNTLGNQLQGLGQQQAQLHMQKTAQDAAIARDRQEKFDRQQAIKLFSEFQIAEQQREQAYEENYKGDWNNYAKSNLEDYDKFYQNYTTEPMSQNAADLFAQQVANHKVKRGAESLGFQAIQRGAQTKQNFVEGAENLVNNTRTKPFTNFWDNQKKLDELAESSLGPLNRAQVDELKKSYQDRNAIAMLRGKGDVEPGKTLEEIKNGVYDTILTPEGLETVRNQLSHELEQEERQRLSDYRQDIRSQIQDHVESLKQTNTPVLSRAQVEATKDPLLLRQFDIATTVAKDYNRIIKGRENLPLSEQLELVEQTKPTKPGPGYADKFQAYEYLKNEVIKNFKEYNDDKVLATMSNGTVAAKFNQSAAAGRQSSINLQLQKGTSMDSVAIATKQEVTDAVSQINRYVEKGDFDKAKKYMADLQQEFNVVTLGNGETGWDIFKRQMAQNSGEKVNADFLLALNYAGSPNGGEIFSAYQGSEEDYRKLIGTATYNNLSYQVNSLQGRYSSVMGSIPRFNTTKQLATERTLLTKYAARLMNNGLDMKSAAQKAYDDMYPYNVITEPKRKLAIPKDINGTTLNQPTILQNLDVVKTSGWVYRHLSEGVTEKGSVRRDQARLSVKNNLNGKDVYLRYDAAQAFEIANKAMLSIGGTAIQVNSGTRSRSEQEALYQKYLKGGPTAAKPGHSTHESAIGIDVENYAAARPHLEKAGFVYRPHPKDPWHFEYVGKGYAGGKQLPANLSDEGRRRNYAQEAATKGVWITNKSLTGAQLYVPNKDGQMVPLLNGKDEPYEYSYTELSGSKYATLRGSTETNEKVPGRAPVNYTNQNRGSAKKQQQAAQMRKNASTLAGRKVERDDEAKFIMDRGF